ncbi:acyltransferase family protein [Desulfosporosinus hippei]|uniref:Peptidoglycan/LPS O-acetylase OafA/YrhL, contains acyltransferase and SGNH-hydrolase domains n=1 Tax=Desulfosporosinus hippei DSM 8344 TaxID=1121419 RepID=A0A1G7U6J1_9FIRM|nr:acyltransferase [Desulfosporosinus hippei]SDG42881.1 Peptidoglycan/LPS O-acetylase OafA/YrhL, contains acyltransferase and SGNH-hydrolase domains [Desulfosporosinus hippei DSM 8344]
MNKQSSEQLKGIAILLVVVGHLFVTKFINTANPAFNYLGAQGVAIFLILSGYGITSSYLTKGLDKSFLERRLRTVLLPYSLVTLVWFVYDYIKGTAYPLRTILLSLFGLDFKLTMDGTMWYIFFILMWYCVFYLLFSLKLPTILKVGLLFGFAYLLRYHSRFNLTEVVYWQWGLHAIMFPLGSLLALVPLKSFSKQTLRLGFGLMGTMGLVTYLLNYRDNDLGLGPYMLSNLGFALVAFSVIIILGQQGYYSRLLGFIGSISYEVYLLEAVFMYKFALPYVLPNKVLSLGLYLLALVGASLLLKKGMKQSPIFSRRQDLNSENTPGPGLAG